MEKNFDTSECPAKWYSLVLFNHPILALEIQAGQGAVFDYLLRESIKKYHSTNPPKMTERMSKYFKALLLVSRNAEQFACWSAHLLETIKNTQNLIQTEPELDLVFGF